MKFSPLEIEHGFQLIEAKNVLEAYSGIDCVVAKVLNESDIIIRIGESHDPIYQYLRFGNGAGQFAEPRWHRVTGLFEKNAADLKQILSDISFKVSENKNPHKIVIPLKAPIKIL